MQLAEPYSLRPEAVSDRSFLSALFASKQESLFALLDPGQRDRLIDMQFNAQAAQYRAMYHNADFDIVLQSGEPIGRLCVDRSGAHWVLVDIALRPEQRNMGIGRLLLQGLLRDASERNAAVELRVALLNPARKLYERLGFAEIASDGVYVAMRWSR